MVNAKLHALLEHSILCQKRTCLFLEEAREGGDNDPVDEVAPGGGEQIQGLDDGLHGGRGLRVGELEAGDAEEDLAAG